MGGTVSLYNFALQNILDHARDNNMSCASLHMIYTFMPNQRQHPYVYLHQVLSTTDTNSEYRS
jgi:hypothetical protein